MIDDVYEIEDELPKYDFHKEYDELGGFNLSNAWEWFLYYRWLINLFFVAIPFAFYWAISLVWNIWMNVVMSKWWAHANIFLIA